MHVIHLHRAAPPKPAVGAACNGCGVCCVVETCPLARLRFLRRRGPCPALLWRDDEGRYRCGLLAEPTRWLPLPEALARRWVARWIAAGKGCDCDYEAQT